MSANSGGFVVFSSFLAEVLQGYTYDHADVYMCKECGKEFRWKCDDMTICCIYCDSLDHELIRVKSEY